MANPAKTPLMAGEDTLDTTTLYLAPAGSNAGFQASIGDAFCWASTGPTSKVRRTRPAKVKSNALFTFIPVSFFFHS